MKTYMKKFMLNTVHQNLYENKNQIIYSNSMALNLAKRGLI